MIDEATESKGKLQFEHEKKETFSNKNQFLCIKRNSRNFTTSKEKLKQKQNFTN